jgi:hypothetical protein
VSAQFAAFGGLPFIVFVPALHRSKDACGADENNPSKGSEGPDHISGRDVMPKVRIPESEDAKQREHNAQAKYSRFREGLILARFLHKGTDLRWAIVLVRRGERCQPTARAAVRVRLSDDV